MAILRELNEFVQESCVLALEPARTCACSCTWCFAALNSKVQDRSRTKSVKDDSTFERLLEKAYGPSYDPTHFLQFALRNKFVLGYSNTVEPWQDVAQAIGILKACDKFNIPLFIQTRTLNFFEICDYLAPFNSNSTVFVSISTLDHRVVKRFEPGTPSIADRLQVIKCLADMGFFVIGALSPYSDQWCDDPRTLVRTLVDHGISEIFYDNLHLNQRQYKIAPDRVMAEMAIGRGKPMSPRGIEHLRIIHEEALANDLEFFMPGFEGTCYGLYNTIATISPDYCFGGSVWPYADGRVFRELESIFYSEDEGINPLDRDPNDSIVVRWGDILSILHSVGEIDQPFSYGSLMDVVPIYKRISDSWKKRILGDKHTRGVAPMSEWFRALFNNPYKHQFFHRHPWISIASNMDGVPYLDDEGNLICLFDPDFTDRTNRHFRRVPSLEPFREIEYGYQDTDSGTNE
jgi:DNA repair photolyase